MTRNLNSLREHLQKVERQLEQAQRAQARSKSHVDEDEGDILSAFEAERDELLRQIAKLEGGE